MGKFHEQTPVLTVGEEAHLLQGENAAGMRSLIPTHAGKVSLVYIDPPFDTGAHWRMAQTGEVAYTDRFEGNEYLRMMRERLVLLHELLAEDGSLMLHCDARRVHHLAVLCDEVFGEGARGPDAGAPGFRNEIVWLYGLGGSSPRYYPRKHDTILWYSKGRDWVFEPPLIPARSNRMKGQLKKCPDWWEIPTLNNMAKERTGYPTQKPEALLERIVGAHSRPGDLVADFFCGSGTSLAVAARMGRRWIGCDASAQAIEIASTRLREAGIEHRAIRV